MKDFEEKIKRCQEFLRERNVPEKGFFPSVRDKDALVVIIFRMLELEDAVIELKEEVLRMKQIEKEISENPELKDVECLNHLLDVACETIRKLTRENLELKKIIEQDKENK